MTSERENQALSQATQEASNVTRADFMQKAIAQASGKGLDTNAALANLALTIIDLQKDGKNAAQAIQMLSQSLGQLMEAHNRLAKHVEDTCGAPKKISEVPPLAS